MTTKQMFFQQVQFCSLLLNLNSSQYPLIKPFFLYVVYLFLLNIENSQDIAYCFDNDKFFPEHELQRQVVEKGITTQPSVVIGVKHETAINSMYEESKNDYLEKLNYLQKKQSISPSEDLLSQIKNIETLKPVVLEARNPSVWCRFKSWFCGYC